MNRYIWNSRCCGREGRRAEAHLLPDLNSLTGLIEVTVIDRAESMAGRNALL
jgi:hypothetical protein